MPRYLVTLRHAETGETRDVEVWEADPREAFFAGEEKFDGNYVNDRWVGGWLAAHVAPADDEPVPFRDR